MFNLPAAPAGGWRRLAIAAVAAAACQTVGPVAADIVVETTSGERLLLRNDGTYYRLPPGATPNLGGPVSRLQAPSDPTGQPNPAGSLASGTPAQGQGMPPRLDPAAAAAGVQSVRPLPAYDFGAMLPRQPNLALPQQVAPGQQAAAAAGPLPNAPIRNDPAAMGAMPQPDIAGPYAYAPPQAGYMPYQPDYSALPPGYWPAQPGYMPQQPGYMPQQPGYMPQGQSGEMGFPPMGSRTAALPGSTLQSNPLQRYERVEFRDLWQAEPRTSREPEARLVALRGWISNYGTLDRAMLFPDRNVTWDHILLTTKVLPTENRKAFESNCRGLCEVTVLGQLNPVRRDKPEVEVHRLTVLQ